MSSLILSDLHLPAKASPLREAFAAFLAGPARKAEAVYLLGDLFEYWIGDDVGLAAYPEEIRNLKALRASGVPVYFMHGNRDFLVGKAFSRATGVQLLPDPSVVNLHGTPTLLSHGDPYCTDDIAYQKWRRFSRNPFAQWIFNLLPRSRREKIAGGLRSQSNEDKRWKPEDIMDVSPQAIDSAFAQHKVKRMIHGHTHRPAEHPHANGCERIVLADWRSERMEYLEVDASGIRRIAL